MFWVIGLLFAAAVSAPTDVEVAIIDSKGKVFYRLALPYDRAAQVVVEK